MKDWMPEQFRKIGAVDQATRLSRHQSPEFARTKPLQPSVANRIRTHEPKPVLVRTPFYTHEPKPGPVRTPFYTHEPKPSLGPHRFLHARTQTRLSPAPRFTRTNPNQPGPHRVLHVRTQTRPDTGIEVQC